MTRLENAAIEFFTFISAFYFIDNGGLAGATTKYQKNHASDPLIVYLSLKPIEFVLGQLPLNCIVLIFDQFIPFSLLC